MSLDLSNDWMVIDDRITVTYQKKVGDGVPMTVSTVNNVAIGKITKEDFQHNPGLLENDVMILHLWTNQLGGIIPKIGDAAITPDDNTWSFKRVQVMDQDATGYQRYRCTGNRK